MTTFICHGSVGLAKLIEGLSSKCYSKLPLKIQVGLFKFYV
jgi:hypothetical protein